jgi:carbonic anhydrase/acetyltransferase-like protein (isoleucine patch superfamily)
MGAIVMDEAVVEENCLIAAGAVILEIMVCHAGGVYAGVPAKRVKELTPELFQGQIERIANNYIMYSGWFK